MSLKFWLIPTLCFLSAHVAFSAEVLYATQDVAAKRFSDADTPAGLDLKAGTRLEVVFRKDDLVRVQASGSPTFGWIPVALTSADPPADAAPSAPPAAGIELGKPINLTLPKPTP